jgi:hypothetical protein
MACGNISDVIKGQKPKGLRVTIKISEKRPGLMSEAFSFDCYSHSTLFDLRLSGSKIWITQRWSVSDRFEGCSVSAV